MKPSTKKIIQIASALIGVAIIGNVLLFIFNKSPFNLKGFEQERTISAVTVSDINIVSNFGNVKIVPYDGEKIVVQLKGKSEQKGPDPFSLKVTESANQVTINAAQQEKKRLFSIYPASYELLVQLPHKEFEHIQVQTEVAQINVNDIHAKQAVLEASKGNITATNLKGNIHGKSELGNIILHLDSIENDIEAVTTYGNITVTTKKAPAAIQTDLNSGLGKCTLRLPNEKDGSVGVGGPKVKLSSNLGDLALLVNE